MTGQTGKRQARRLGLGALLTGHALIFGAATWAIPWTDYPVFSWFTGILAGSHLASAYGAILGHKWFSSAWRASSLVALGWLATLIVGVTSSALYLQAIYGSLGVGIAVALIVGLLIPVLFTVPLACHALASTSSWRWRREKQAGVMVLLVLFAFSLAKVRGAGEIAKPAPHRDLARALKPLASGAMQRPKAKERISFPATATACNQGVVGEHSSIVVAFQSATTGRAEQRCIQDSNPQLALSKLTQLVEGEASRAPVKVDFVSATQALTDHDRLLDAFKIRPGLDGVCAGSACLMPWQLVVGGLVNRHVPVAAIPELRMGVDPLKLNEALGVPNPRATLVGLTRIETESFVVSDDVTVLKRLRRIEQPLSERSVAQATARAERHIARALEKDGSFRYQLAPVSGLVDVKGFNLPRQAGTTLATCELATKARARRIAPRALKHIARLERRDPTSVLVYPAGSKRVALGDQALSLVAFTSCRRVVGRLHDDLIVRLSKTLLRMQTERGDFFATWNVAQDEPDPGPPPLFAPGQAVMALVLLEKMAEEDDRLNREQLRQAAQKAMDHYGGPYWDHPLGKLFYVEENWHCLAARAALRYHRHDAYERFCIAHSEFKARFILDEDAPNDLRGAFALGTMIPPPNTATAGIGEIIAATIAVKRARGEPTDQLEHKLRLIMQFLMRQQHRSYSCFFCAKPRLTIGGFSDSAITPMLRIDFTQHAWAAIGHGAHVLALGPPPRS